MPFVAIAFGLLIAGFGMLAVASPESFAGILRELSTTTGLYFGAGFRVALGAALFLSAPSSRAPVAVRALGLLLLLAGLAMPFMGLDFFRASIGTFLSLGSGVTRAWGVAGLAFGVFIAYAVVPQRRDQLGPSHG